MYDYVDHVSLAVGLNGYILMLSDLAFVCNKYEYYKLIFQHLVRTPCSFKRHLTRQLVNTFTLETLPTHEKRLTNAQGTAFFVLSTP